MHTNPSEIAFFGSGVDFPSRFYEVISAQRLRRITNTLQRSVIETNALRDRSFAIKTNIDLGFDLYATAGCDNNDERNEREDTRQSTVPKHSAQPTSAIVR